MKEIIAVVRLGKVSATKRALVEAGVAGFTASKVLGRGKLVKDPAVIEARKQELLALNKSKDKQEAELLIDTFLNGVRLFPRRLFNVIAHDEDVSRIVQAIMAVNRTDNQVGDGKIFVLPLSDAVRVRTGETGDSAIW